MKIIRYKYFADFFCQRISESNLNINLFYGFLSVKKGDAFLVGKFSTSTKRSSLHSFSVVKVDQFEKTVVEFTKRGVAFTVAGKCISARSAN